MTGLQGHGNPATSPEPGSDPDCTTLVQSGEVDEVQLMARRQAERVTLQCRQLQDAVMSQPVPSVAPLAAGALLVVAVWLLVGPWALNYPFTVRGQDIELRDSGFAIVLSLTALRLLLARRSNLATGIALVCGVLLLYAGLVAAHSATRVEVNELIAGSLTVVAALATLDRRPAVADPPKASAAAPSRRLHMGGG